MHIVSLMPGEDASRTCILSRIWRDIWARIPILRLIMHTSMSAQEFEDVVVKTITKRVESGIPINRLVLSSENSYYSVICGWLYMFMNLKVEEVDISFPPKTFFDSFRWNVFQRYNSLVYLTLRGQLFLNVPCGKSATFPHLKKLSLSFIFYSGDEALVNLISGCPKLEEFFVQRYAEFEKDNTVKVFRVLSESLKVLRIDFWPYSSGKRKLLIKAPKLEHIHLMDKLSTQISLQESPTIVEVFICVSRCSPFHMFKAFPSVKMLTLARGSLLLLHDKINKLANPVMPLLTRLRTLQLDACDWNLLMYLLTGMPNLQNVTFLQGLESPLNQVWVPPQQVPHCLLLTLKKFEILKVIQAEELTLLKFLLQYSLHLETLAIPNGNEQHVVEEILGLARVSDSCQIEFI